MRVLLAALVIIFAATSAWLWIERGQEPYRQSATPRESPPAGAPGQSADLTAPATSIPPVDSIPDEITSTTGKMVKQEETFGFTPRVAAELAGNENYITAVRRAKRLNADLQYPDVGRVLDISPEKVDRLLDLLANFKMDAFESKLRQAQHAPDASELVLEEQERRLALESEIRTLLGDEKLSRFRTYRASIMERSEIRGLQYELMNSDDALDFDHAEPVIQALYEERLKIEKELTATHGASDADDDYPGAFVVKGRLIAEFDIASNKRLFSAASRKLTPAQAQAFRRILDDGTAMGDAMSEAERIIAASRASAGERK